MVSEAYKAEAFDRIIAAFRDRDRAQSVYAMVEDESDALEQLEQRLAPCFKCGEPADTDCPDCKRVFCHPCAESSNVFGYVSCCDIPADFVPPNPDPRKDPSP